MTGGVSAIGAGGGDGAAFNAGAVGAAADVVAGVAAAAGSSVAGGAAIRASGLAVAAGGVLPVASGSSSLGCAIAPPEMVNATSTATRATTLAADDPFIGIPSVDAIQN